MNNGEYSCAKYRGTNIHLTNPLLVAAKLLIRQAMQQWMSLVNPSFTI